MAEAENRWQAAEIRKAAERESALREKDRARAREAAIAAGVALNEEELRLREAMLNDPSRAWAWRTLFAIFAVINLAGPLAIARVLEQWRADHGEAKASARDEPSEEVGGGVAAREPLGATGARHAAASGAGR